MESSYSNASMEVLFQVLLIPALIFFLLESIVKKLERSRTQAAGKLPPGPRNLPLIGSIHHLVRQQPAHHTLRDLSKVHGPIMQLRLGEIRAVVISSSEAAREIMKTHDLVFASRPLTASCKIICYGGKDIIFAPHGDYWRKMRRLCISELLSPKRVLSFRAIREDEVSRFLNSIASSSGVIVNLSSKFSGLSNNITARAVIGGKCGDRKLFLSALRDVIKLTLTFSIVDLFPSMPNFICLLAGFRLKRCWLKMDRILRKIVQDHTEKKAMIQGEIEEDLTDVLLRIERDSGNHQPPLSGDNVKAVINDMLMAGSETGSATMEWVMSELVQNPAVMKKAQSEVREVLKGRRTSKMLVEEEFLSGKLSYLPMVIKETLRLHPPVPLLLPRENQEPCEVMGYEIPAKTTVMVNAWAIGRDPESWKDPDTFRPERFEGNRGGDLKGTNFEYIPFGAGRRICPGIHFGLASVETTLAYLLCYFDWKYVPVKGEELDMTETFGPAMRRKTPLRLMATPHFPLLLS